MSDIIKTTITLTVLHRIDDGPEDMSLERISEEMDMGEFLGKKEITSTQVIDPEKVAEEEIALGGDGTFFNL